jgi:hypothetical protein
MAIGMLPAWITRALSADMHAESHGAQVFSIAGRIGPAGANHARACSIPLRLPLGRSEKTVNLTVPYSAALEPDRDPQPLDHRPFAQAPRGSEISDGPGPIPG